MSLVVEKFAGVIPGPHPSLADRLQKQFETLSPEKKETIHRLLNNVGDGCLRLPMRLARPQKNQKVLFWDCSGACIAGVFDGVRFHSQGDYWTVFEVTHWQERLVSTKGE